MGFAPVRTIGDFDNGEDIFYLIQPPASCIIDTDMAVSFSKILFSDKSKI